MTQRLKMAGQHMLVAMLVLLLGAVTSEAARSAAAAASGVSTAEPLGAETMMATASMTDKASARQMLGATAKARMLPGGGRGLPKTTSREHPSELERPQVATAADNQRVEAPLNLKARLLPGGGRNGGRHLLDDPQPQSISPPSPREVEARLNLGRARLLPADLAVPGGGRNGGRHLLDDPQP